MKKGVAVGIGIGVAVVIIASAILTIGIEPIDESNNNQEPEEEIAQDNTIVGKPLQINLSESIGVGDQ